MIPQSLYVVITIACLKLNQALFYPLSRTRELLFYRSSILLLYLRQPKSFILIDRLIMFPKAALLQILGVYILHNWSLYYQHLKLVTQVGRSLRIVWTFLILFHFLKAFLIKLADIMRNSHSSIWDRTLVLIGFKASFAKEVL